MEQRSVEGAREGFRFLVDHMLGTLARNLRMYGFDTVYARNVAPETLIRRALTEGRWLLTRRDLATITHQALTILKIQDDAPPLQILQVLRALPLLPDESKCFTRCLRCNLPLDDLPAEKARALVPEYIALTYSSFRRCPSCERIFWPGSHALRMRKTMERWLKEAREEKGKALTHG